VSATVTVTMTDEHGNVRVLQLPRGHKVQAAADLARQQLDRKYWRSAEHRATSTRPASASEGCASTHRKDWGWGCREGWVGLKRWPHANCSSIYCSAPPRGCICSSLQHPASSLSICASAAGRFILLLLCRRGGDGPVARAPSYAAVYLPTYLPYLATFLSCFHSSSQFEYNRPARHSHYPRETKPPPLTCSARFRRTWLRPPQPLSPHPRDNDGRPLRLARLAPLLTASRQTRPSTCLLFFPPPPFRCSSTEQLCLRCLLSLRSTTPIAIPPSIPSSPLAWSSLADM